MNSYFEKMLCQIIEGKNDLDIDFEQYPKELYRYRPCNENNFDSLENDYLWMSYPSDYKDPFDSFVIVDEEYTAESIEKSILKYLAEITHYLISNNSDNSVTFEEISAMYKELGITSETVYDKALIKQNMKVEFDKLPIQHQTILLDLMEKVYEKERFNSVKESFQKFILSTVNILRNRYTTCCLTKRKDNRNMWENYADNYSGFVIQYSFDKNNDCFELLKYLFEVEYISDILPVDLSEYITVGIERVFYDKNINNASHLLPLVKRLFFKSYDYMLEEEWRLFTGKLESNKAHFPFVSAVYAGYKITDDKLKRLEEICKKKNIPLYKQELDSIGGRFVYYPVDLSED